jgi:sugar phosphate isomerase/epimerase
MAQYNILNMDRRKMLKLAVAFSIYATVPAKGLNMNKSLDSIYSLRLGANLPNTSSPEEWIEINRKLGYSAAYCPIKNDASDSVVRAYENAAKKAGLIISEVGAWSNPISPNEQQQKEAFDYCCKQLELADRIGARCCVNIAGSRNAEKWDGPDKDNFKKDTFDMIVEVTRKIIDTVKPTRTYFSLETMPWIAPDTVDSYFDLVKSIKRERFGVHFDPTNLIMSPRRFNNTGEIIKYGFKKLGKYIKSCHAKDIKILTDSWRTQACFEETLPGTGAMDYALYLTELTKFKDLPLMIEHLKSQDEFIKAANNIRSIAKENNIRVHEI